LATNSLKHGTTLKKTQLTPKRIWENITPLSLHATLPDEIFYWDFAS
jgi:hypothetical protein